MIIAVYMVFLTFSFLQTDPSALKNWCLAGMAKSAEDPESDSGATR